MATGRGGVGESGWGSYHGEAGFLRLSQQKPVAEVRSRDHVSRTEPVGFLARHEARRGKRGGKPAKRHKVGGD